MTCDWEIMGKLGDSYSPVPAELCVCPVVVPTDTLGAARFMLTMGASAEKYMSVVLESMMLVGGKEDIFFLFL